MFFCFGKLNGKTYALLIGPLKVANYPLKLLTKVNIYHFRLQDSVVDSTTVITSAETTTVTTTEETVTHTVTSGGGDGPGTG